MNWLTTQLARLQYFGDLASESFDTPEPGLRIVRFASVRQALRSLDVGIVDDEVSLDPYVLFVEDVESAAARAGRATPTGRGPLSPTFTLALDDGKETVLYLPEDYLPTQDVQLFDLVD